MASQGIEHVYIQMWLVSLLSADTYLQSSIVLGKIIDLSGAEAADTPAVLLTATPDQEPTETANGVRSLMSIVFAIEATIAGNDLLPLLPVMNRIDVILSRVRNTVWVAPDSQTLTVFSVRRTRSYSDAPKDGDQMFRIVGAEYRIQAQVELTGDVVA